MHHCNKFRLSELYLACRSLGARHVLTDKVVKVLPSLATPEFYRDIMNAPTTFGDSQVIPFRRHPIDLRFACALAGSNTTGPRPGFVVCSDEALGYIGALGIRSAATPYYSLEEKPRDPVILEEHDIFRALDALSQPDIMHAAVRADSDKPDTLHITLPAKLLTQTQGKRFPKDALSFTCRIFPRTAAPETLTHLTLQALDAQRVTLKIGTENLMVCHHAGLQGLPFELITADFAITGTFPDMLDTPCDHMVHHTPVGLFHSIFKGLDNKYLTLPADIAHELRSAVHWLNETEFAT